MIKETWRGHGTARFIYYSYKDSPYYSLLIISLIFCACFMLFFNIVVPQVENWLSIRDEAVATQLKIKNIQDNTAYISSLNKSMLESNRQIVNQALPVDKDFAAIINAVTASSVRSGIAVDDFSFGVGPISSSSAKPVKKGDEPDSVYLNLSLKGTTNDIIVFIKEIREKLPLSQLEKIDTVGGSTTLTLTFLSKEYKPVRVNVEEPIRPVSPQNTSTINALSQWAASGIGNPNEPPPSRSSDIPIF